MNQIARLSCVDEWAVCDLLLPAILYDPTILRYDPTVPSSGHPLPSYRIHTVSSIMGYYPDFAKLLDDYLYEQHCSQSWLTKRLGVRPSAVNRWCKGEVRPNNPETIIRLADLFGVHEQANQQELLAAAGYGYQDTPEGETVASTNSSGKNPVAPVMLPRLPTPGV